MKSYLALIDLFQRQIDGRDQSSSLAQKNLEMYDSSSMISEATADGLNDPTALKVWGETFSPVRTANAAKPVLEQACAHSTGLTTRAEAAASSRATEHGPTPTTEDPTTGDTQPDSSRPTATAVPNRGDGAPEFVGWECHSLLNYWGPLIAKDMAQSSQVANDIIQNSYAGNAIGLNEVHTYLKNFAAHPQRGTDLKSAIESTCSSTPID